MSKMEQLYILEEYLKEKGIKYQRIDQMASENFGIERHQIIVPSAGDDFAWDVICQYGSYGYEKGLLELYGNLVDEEKDGDTVVGWLTAQDVITRIEAKAKEV